MSDFHLRCTECKRRYEEDVQQLVCPTCAEQQVYGGLIRGVLEVVLHELPTSWPQAPLDTASLAQFLPIPSQDLLPPLPAGGTPLLPVQVLRQHLRMPHLWLKDDTRNPSGSTKDRASALVVAKAQQYEFDTIATASTGNAASALAAMAAAVGARAVTVVPDTTPEAKLAQMLSYGAKVVPVKGTYDDAFDLCCEACRTFGWYNRNTALNPYTIEGKKTAALEIAAQLAPAVPDAVVVPTGDGVIIAGVAKGFADLQSAGLLRTVPRLIAVQPEGSAAIVTALHTGATTPAAVPRAHSVADSLTVQMPRNGLLSLQVIRDSAGGGVMASDDAILESIADLARRTGVFAEPAAAAALAGLQIALHQQLVDRDECVVLLITGNGLKDIPASLHMLGRPTPIPPTLDAVAELLSLPL